MNRTRSNDEIRALAESLGPAEKLVNLIINFPDHLWHNRPGVIRNGRWKAANRKEIEEHREHGRLADGAEFQSAGPNKAAIVRVYSTLAEIWQANNELAARLASYIMRETDWRDMKMICSAFMLVQNKVGEPVLDDEDGSVLFHDDDYREVGEAMIKSYQRGSDRMMNPKLILRIRDILSIPEVAEINRELGFGNPQKRKPFTGRYYKAVEDWLAFRESNPTLLEGLKKAGYGSTVKNLARMVGYKPKSQRFFEILGWKQSQAKEGHRKVGLENLKIEKLSFEGLDEEQICEKIVNDGLGWKLVMGMLPPDTGLTPAICVALLDQFSDKDFAILTPTLEEFGLLDHSAIRERWSEALNRLEDQRTRNIAKNVQKKELAEQLDQAADDAVSRAVEEATKEADIHIMFLIDISASMEGAIELSKEALSMIVQGFPQERLHISCFNTVGYLLKPKHYSAKGIRHMLKSIGATGGTIYATGMAVFRANKVRVPDGADLIVFAVGDEAGEAGEDFARNIREYGYQPSAFAHIVNVARGWARGSTVRRASEVLGVPYTEIEIEQLRDVYQVQRTLKGILEAQPFRGSESLIEKILRSELLTKPY
jgi:hypothetical protein